MLLQNLYSITPTHENETFPQRNFRFALVMHAVAQELYKMLPATANRRVDSLFGAGGIEKLEGTPVVFWALGESLRARFAIHIISGTSAGGINSVYLARELANNLPMRQLEDL